jgi:hypothetical protein
MSSMVLQGRVAFGPRRAPVRRSGTGLAGGAALAVAVLVLLALLPGFAGTAGSTAVGAPQPYPAPVPSYGGGPGSLEQVRP